MSYCHEKAKPFKGFRAWVLQVRQNDRHVNLQQAQCVLVPHLKKHVNQQGEVQARWTKNNYGLETKKRCERKNGCAHLSMQEHGNWSCHHTQTGSKSQDLSKERWHKIRGDEKKYVRNDIDSNNLLNSQPFAVLLFVSMTAKSSPLKVKFCLPVCTMSRQTSAQGELWNSAERSWQRQRHADCVEN